jgi:hypothetical protein
MNKKFSVGITAGLVIAIACGTATAAQASGASFGPAAVQQAEAPNQTAAARFDASKSPVVTDLGAVFGTSNRDIQIVGQDVQHSVYEVYVNGTYWKSIAPGQTERVQVTSDKLNRFGPNTIQVRQRLFWVDNQTTAFASMTYNADQQGPTGDDFLAAATPKVTAPIATYNEQGIAVVRLQHRNVDGAHIEAIVNGRTFTQANLGSYESVLLLDGLQPGTNDVSFAQVAADGSRTPETHTAVRLLSTPAPAAPVVQGDKAEIAVTTDQAGTLSLRDVNDRVVDSVATTGSGARAAYSLSAPVTDQLQDLAVVFQAGDFVSDPKHVEIAAAGATEERPLVVTSSTTYEPNEKKVITGTGTPGYQVRLDMPTWPFTQYVDVQEDGTWSITTPTLSAGGVKGNTLSQWTADGGIVGTPTQFDLAQDPTWSPLGTSVQDRGADWVQLGLNAPAQGSVEIFSADGDPLGRAHVGYVNATLPLRVATNAEATTLKAVFTPKSGGTTIERSVPVQAFASTGNIPATISSPLEFQVAGDLVLSGKGTPDADLRIEIPGKPIDETIKVGTDGAWSYTVHDLGGTGFDGNKITQTTTDGSNTVRFSLKGKLDVDPVGTDGVVAEKRPSFSGTGDAGSEVSVVGKSGRVVASAKVASDGTWTAPATFDLGLGVYDLDVKQASIRGAAETKSVRFTVAAAASVAPLVVTSPTANGTVAGPKPTFTGTGDAKATIRIAGKSGRVVAETTVGTDGTWTEPAGFDLAKGVYDLVVTQTATNGAVSTKDLRFTVR